MTTTPPVPPGAFLRQAHDGRIDAPRHLWGFGGLHGGLALAVLTSIARQRPPEGSPLRSATVRLHHPITDALAVETTAIRDGRISVLTAQASNDGRVHADASVILGVKRSGCPPVTPVPPLVPPALDCEAFAVPPEFVPIATFMEVRPVGRNRPYAGCVEPELTAWIRLLEDDEPPDEYRLILLMDSLASSYAAILTDVRPIPSIELTVHAGRDLPRASSPWVLLHARTRWADAEGWLEETIDAWGPDGVFIGAAHQLRVVR